MRSIIKAFCCLTAAAFLYGHDSVEQSRADVVVAYELISPPEATDGVISVVQGGPGQPLVITLEESPGEYTLTILCLADVDSETALYGYGIGLSAPDSDAVTATGFKYAGPFDYDVPPVMGAGPGLLIDQAIQGTFNPASGFMELFEVTLVVTVPTEEVRIFSETDEAYWGTLTYDPFTLIFADSDPLIVDLFDAKYSVSSTPNIIIRAGQSEQTDCDSNGLSDEEELALQPSLDCNTNGVLDRCEIAAGEAVDCNGNGVPDACDIAGGLSLDTDFNGVPDECQIQTTPIDATDSATTIATQSATESASEDGNNQQAKVYDRKELRSKLATIFGIPWEGGFSLSCLTWDFYGPISLPMSLAIGGVEVVSLPVRLLVFELSYCFLDAILP